MTRASVLALLVLLLSAGAAQTANQRQHREYVSRPDLKPQRVQILKQARGTAPGYVFIAPKKDALQDGPLIVDNNGNVIWFLPLSGGATDFRAQRYLGKPVLTWWRGRSEDGERLGRYAIYDSSYRLIKSVRPGNGLAGDMHEFAITPQNTVLMTLSNRVRVKGRRVLEGAFQELDLRTGRVLFEWHSIDHVKLVESFYKLPKDPARTFDYFHINTVERDNDGHLLVSARNTHTIYKIHAKTGKVIWRLGGKRSDFELGRSVRFSWQHDVRRHADGTLSIFDNAAAPQMRPQSRGIILRLDMKRMRATLLRTFVHRPPILSVDQANMQRLPNGNFLIGWGHEPYVTEFGPRGKILWDARFGRGRVDSYRAYRFPWTGRPKERPAVELRDGSVYVSWNGATDVVRWQVLGGDKRNDLRPLVTVRKTGFETRIALPRATEYVAVRALDRKARSMARSGILRRE
jgi:hypothetical protein